MNSRLKINKTDVILDEFNHINPTFVLSSFISVRIFLIMSSLKCNCICNCRPFSSNLFTCCLKFITVSCFPATSIANASLDSNDSCYVIKIQNTKKKKLLHLWKFLFGFFIMTQIYFYLIILLLTLSNLFN